MKTDEPLYICPDCKRTWFDYGKHLTCICGGVLIRMEYIEEDTTGMTWIDGKEKSNGTD
jgi:hypothetical protein